MVRVVFDLNVLISAALSPKGASYGVVQLAATRRIDGYISIALVERLKLVVQRDFGLTSEKAEEMVGVYLQVLKLVEPDVKIDELEDQEDNRVLECAVHSKADYLVSWDPHLTKLNEFRGISAFNPGKIIEVLREVHSIE
jgi:putative PIN family toxin of toxin-antitoxin system